MKELTQEQIDRQDAVDNAINNLLAELSNNQLTASHFTQFDRGQIRDIAEGIICRDFKAMTTKEFYPYL